MITESSCSECFLYLHHIRMIQLDPIIERSNGGLVSELETCNVDSD
jgi:hypothetical protein